MEAFACPEQDVLRLGFNLLTAVTMAMQAESKVGGGNRATVVFFVTILVVSAAFAVYSVLPAHKAQLALHQIRDLLARLVMLNYK